MHERDEFSFKKKKLQEKAYFIVKMPGPPIIRPASSEFWKAP